MPFSTKGMSREDMVSAVHVLLSILLAPAPDKPEPPAPVGPPQTELRTRAVNVLFNDGLRVEGMWSKRKKLDGGGWVVVFSSEEAAGVASFIAAHSMKWWATRYNAGKRTLGELEAFSKSHGFAPPPSFTPDEMKKRTEASERLGYEVSWAWM